MIAFINPITLGVALCIFFKVRSHFAVRRAIKDFAASLTEEQIVQIIKQSRSAS